MGKPKFNREAALAYAHENGIEEVTEDMKDKAVIRIVEEWVGDQEYDCAENAGGCGHYIRDEDTYCWYCGDDTTMDGTGGFGKEKEQEPEKPKKKEKKKEPKPKEKKEEKEETALKAVEEKDIGDELYLDDRTALIKKLDNDMGSNAWEIGSHLHLIAENQQWKQNEHKSFDEYCEKELGFTRKNVYVYIRIAQGVIREEAADFGVMKLYAITSAKSEKGKRKLLKAAEKGATVKALAELARDVTQEERKAKGETGKGSGRPPLSKFRNFVDVEFDGKLDNDTAIAELDDTIGIEVKVLKSKVKLRFIELGK